MEALKERICYLHLYENVGDVSHLPPGSGGIPEADWIYLVRGLKEMNFQGPAVLEIRPPHWETYPKDPVETALQAKRYLDHLMEV